MLKKDLTVIEGFEFWIVNCKRRGLTENTLNYYQTIKKLIKGVSFFMENYGYDEWAITVIFNDESNALYYYNYRQGEISLGGLSGYTDNRLYKHAEPEPIYK